MKPDAEARIHDALTAPLSRQGALIPLVDRQDHLLRRFGGADAVVLDGGQARTQLRAAADEVWALVTGEATFELDDLRAGSPSRGVRETRSLTAPARVLVPFGVRLTLRAERHATLLRVMTHSEAEDPPLDPEP